MTDGTLGVVMLAVITLMTSVACHAFIRHSVIAVTLSSVLATAGFWIFCFIHDGHLDAFFLIALPITFVITLVASLLIGGVFAALRSRPK